MHGLHMAVVVAGVAAVQCGATRCDTVSSREEEALTPPGCVEGETGSKAWERSFAPQEAGLRMTLPSMEGVCEGVEAVEGRPKLALQPIIEGGPALTDGAFAPGDPGLLLVLEQHTGKVRVLRDLKPGPTPFLDLEDEISTGSEQGLLGITFHPRHPKDARVFIFYTDEDGTVIVASYTPLAGRPEQADASSRRVVLRVPQPEPNHNGGGLRFGPDGLLYLTLGDGGGAGDAHGEIGNGQKKDTLLGKMLRIDVDGSACGNNYSIPESNPFPAQPGFRPEILHWGLRNAWRFSFDRGTGDLWIGDVGQNKWEELDFVPSTTAGGINFGWRCKEGLEKYKWDPHCETEDLVVPILVKENGGPEGFCSIVPGYVYRGCRMPGYHGTLFYGDWCADHLRQLEIVDGKVAERAVNQEAPLKISGLSSWFEDGQGELHLTTTEGALYKLVPAPRR